MRWQRKVKEGKGMRKTGRGEDMECSRVGGVDILFLEAKMCFANIDLGRSIGIVK